MHLCLKKIIFVSPLKKLWWVCCMALAFSWFWFLPQAKLFESVKWVASLTAFHFWALLIACWCSLPSEEYLCICVHTSTGAHNVCASARSGIDWLVWKHAGLLSWRQHEQYICTLVTSSACGDSGKMVSSSLWAGIADTHTLFHRELDFRKRLCKLAWLRMFQSLKVYTMYAYLSKQYS